MDLQTLIVLVIVTLALVALGRGWLAAFSGKGGGCARCGLAAPSTPAIGRRLPVLPPEPSKK
ncbi:MAG: hypothetical protein V1798_06825 [Pseudomonadota bacterium]